MLCILLLVVNDRLFFASIRLLESNHPIIVNTFQVINTALKERARIVNQKLSIIEYKVKEANNSRMLRCSINQYRIK